MADTSPPTGASHADDPMPQPPREPEAWECCQSGCDPCVYDRYWQAFERYEEAVAAWRGRHSRHSM